MQLLTAHRILIGSAIAFSLVLVAYQVVEYRRGGSWTSVLLAGAFLLGGGALSVYFWRLRRRTG